LDIEPGGWAGAATRMLVEVGAGLLATVSRTLDVVVTVAVNSPGLSCASFITDYLICS
jgi:hypothetical protein